VGKRSIFTVNLPDIGEGVVEGEVLEWLKKLGDELHQDEPVVVVMTDKATVELPAPQPGKLAKCYFQPGEKAILNHPLYDIELSSETSSSNMEPVQDKFLEKQIPKEELKKSEVLPTKRGLSTPATRRLARELGIDISKIAGSGKGGRVLVEDIKNHVIQEIPSINRLSGDIFKPIIGIPALMAKRMAESKRLIPHFTYCEIADATRLVQLRHKLKSEGEKEGLHITYMPFFIRALSLTIQQFPQINSALDSQRNELILHQRQNVGIAISTKQGLIVPVLKDVQNKGIKELVCAFEELKEKAFTGHLKSSDMQESTISISNYGVLGGNGMWATPIINYPEIAILAVNKIQKQPMVKNEELVVRNALNLSWSFDHRIIDGDMAANISHYFVTLIQNPAALL
jgi:pyruvate dehydrogenase E2 component (dihydrolipoamide acetyltransferase)